MHKLKSFRSAAIAAAVAAAFLAASPAQAQIKDKFWPKAPNAVSTTTALPSTNGRLDGRVSKVQPTLTQQLMIALGMAPDEFVAQEEGLVLSEKEKK